MDDEQKRSAERSSEGAAKEAAEVAVPESAKQVLTPEEQLALYEKELKENDWGHQPC